MPESPQSPPPGASGTRRLRGAAMPAAVVAVSVLLVLVVVSVSALMGTGRASVIPVAGGSPSDQGQVLDDTQAGAGDQPSPVPPPAAFRPLTFQAESATLVPPGGAEAVYRCATCSGGAKVRSVGKGRSVVFSAVTVPGTGTYHLTIGYELVGSRTFWVSVNGSPWTKVPCTGKSWSTPASATVPVALRAGPNVITVGNQDADAPDLDRITIAA